MSIEKNNLGRFYYHIDNGGIEIEINAQVEREDGEDSFILPEIVFGTSYFGYARLESKLVGFELSPKLLKEMGLFFINAAAELERLQIHENG